MTKKGWVKELGYVAEENRTYFYLKHCYQDLNDEIEIIEDESRNIEVCGSLFTRSEYNRLAGIEEDKKIEKITMVNEFESNIVSHNQARIKINEIIDYLNKGDK